ncbi:MdtA/MuxA family multidrug efflux RND transporter periplasmic adaptor subunit [Luteimonas huabeiensis]|uniref:MdtA/MuxA family multidrug efflux RND transporter periplasmic adaptor subunit n=1 Tax=Luteimonas huabeiensis TaxID=1244513 RepID=UPI000463335E|nr:MdtA/MuxA family multidrug efflux RND transporter periplasmic adaptor subunit [Luteimonas huabeiensis]
MTASKTKPLLIVAAVVVAGVLLWRGCSGDGETPAAGPGGPGFGPGGERPPTPVRVAPAVREPLAVQLKALGTATPLQSVTVRSRVDGELLRIAFEEGQAVEAGDLLAEIDPAPFRIRLAQAEGQQKQHLAELENARIQLQRFRDLARDAYVSAQDVANLEAQVRQFEARREIDQAAVDEARLQLRYTRIVAPVAGRVGLRTVDVGNLVRSSDAEGLVSIAQTRPISVLFSIPETALPELTAAVRRDRQLPVEAWDREERRRLATGTLASIDNRIDTATGTLRLRALFANEDDTLFPNQSVNVRLQLADDEALTIPDAAVQFGSQGTYVYAIDDDDTARVRPVRLGASSGGRVAVLEGLQPGERVVLEGLDRLREGAKVEVVQTDAPADADDAPAP